MEKNKDVIVQEGIVLDTNGGNAKVQSAKAGCTCSGNIPMIIDAVNTPGATKGQRVEIEIPQTKTLRMAFLFFILPMISAFMGAFLGNVASEKWNLNQSALNTLGGIGGFLLSILYIKFMDNRVGSDSKFKPVITKILSE